MNAGLAKLLEARAWAPLGVFMHLGIASTMELGMFSFGMLALYPVFFADPSTKKLLRPAWTMRRTTPPSTSSPSRP